MRKNVREQIRRFSAERGWDQFHNAKDLAISLSIEAAELLENFQWKTASEAVVERKSEICDELADVLIYAAMLGDGLEVDLDKIVLRKIKKNKMKYPISGSYGSAKKYTEVRPCPGRVVLQPCSGPVAQDHMDRTVRAEKSLSEIGPYLRAGEREALQKIYPGGSLNVWGIVTNSTFSAWDAIKVGDLVLFYANKQFVYMAEVTYKTINPELSKFLWDVDKKGRPWENMYFIKDVQPISIAIKEYNKVMKHKESSVVRRFDLLSEEKSDLIKTHFGL